MDVRRARSENAVRAKGADFVSNRVRVDTFTSAVVERARQDATDEIRPDRRTKLGSESVFHLSLPIRKVDDVERRVKTTRRAGQVLGTKHIRMLSDRKDLRLLVEMFRRRHTMTACNEA